MAHWPWQQVRPCCHVVASRYCFAPEKKIERRMDARTARPVSALRTPGKNEARVCEIEYNKPYLAQTCAKESSADDLHGGSRARRKQIQVCRLATMISFLDLPPEIRLPIYAHFLDEHTSVRGNRQPNNGHYRLLHVCRAIYYEARPTFRTYVSLAYERQINAFIRCADPEDLTHILWADVANDGRYLSNVDPRLLQKESSSEVSGK